MNRKKGFRLLAMLLVTVLLLTSSSLSTASASTTKKWTFYSIAYKSAWGTSYSISGSSATVTFEGQYREIQFYLPETVDMSTCTKVIFNASSPSGSIAFKLYNTSGTEVDVNYGFQSSSSTDCSFTPSTTDEVNCIGIMALDDSSYSAVINSVAFTVSEDSSGTSTTDSTLLSTYGSVLGKVGTCIDYSELCDSTTLSAVKKDYNSITLENEMKPDYILGSSASLLTVSEAENLGYYIPDSYTESTVPKLNFTTVDNTLALCYQNGLSVRAHTLVWHSQTPDWYFREGYSSTGSYVSESVMNARMEFYIKTFMNHVYTSQYGSVVYAWDVVNEYLHASTSGWSSIYGDQGTEPAYVKQAFQYAYDCLSYFGLTDSVKLFYNDYNTYMVADDIVTMINYINSSTQLCAGVGMQSHLSTSYPSVSLYKTTLEKFVSAGFEIQITELDIGNSSDSVQAQYCYDLFSAILSVKQAGGNITGLTLWGMYDGESWRSSQSPLLYSTLTTPKSSYEQVLQAYTDAGY